MHHIRDKKMWWAANFCRPTVKVEPNPAFDILGSVGLVLAVSTILLMGALLMSAAPTPTLVTALLIPMTAMESLEAYLRRTARRNVHLRADFSSTIEDLQNDLIELAQKTKNLISRADSENRKLTDDEQRLFDSFVAQFNSVKDEIARRETLAGMEGAMAKPAGRKSEADPRPPYGTAARTDLSARDDKGKHGFRSFGEFVMAVVSSSRKGSRIDPMLVAAAAPTTSSEDIGSDGGFAVPPDFRQEIVQKVMAEDSLLARTDQLTTSSNSVTVPVDETTDFQTSGGVQAYWENEIAQATASKVQLQNTTCKANKLIALVPCTDELLEDAPALSSYLRRKAPEKISFRVNDAIINGSGAGQPLGIMNANAKVTVDKESAQGAGTVVFQNIVNMWARLHRQCRPNAIWLVNQDVEPQLIGMTVPGTAPAFPAYLPPGGLSASPYGSLMGRPVVPTEACQEVGTEGDIILTDLTRYMSVTKIGGLRQDVSIHLYFDFDLTAFRFVLRVGGQSWWSKPVARKNSSKKLSSIVSLEAR